MTVWDSPHRRWLGTFKKKAPQPTPRPLLLQRLPARVEPQRYKVLNIGMSPAVVDVHDGDTMRMVLVTEREGGCGIWPWLRLDGCDAYELHKPGGPEAQEWAAAFLANASNIEVILFGWSFDRRVARVIADGVDMTRAIIEAGHAVPWSRTKA